jgi:DNA-binding NarL/FixJ family response regulator
MKPKLQVLVAEPSDIIREGLRVLLDDDEFVLQAPLRELPMDFAQRIARSQPDILILNPTLLNTPPRMQLVSIQQARTSMAVVALVYQYVDPSLLSQFRTVLDIRERGSRVAQLLRQCCAPEAEDEEGYELSERETEVLVLLARGCSSKEIADKLNISVHTVNTHRKNITRKTGIKSVAGLAVYALLHNLVAG